MSKVTFNNSNNEFYSTLKKRVAQHFADNKVEQTGNWNLYHKTIVLFVLLIGCYTTLVFFTPGVVASVILCAVLGLSMASIGFNVMHDACHGSYSTNGKINNLLGYSLNLLGGTCFFWKQKHNIVHHTYTNVDGVDDDIAKSPLLRHCHTQKWHPIHKAQHLYLGPVYAITSLAWVFIMDFQKYFSRKIYTTDAWEMNTSEHLIFWGTKAFFLLAYIALPIYMVGFSAWIIGFLVTHVAMGFVLAIVFQLAHVVEHIDFVPAYDDTKIEEAWAIHQVRTTANFARFNKVINWYVGGLNFQVEHHLFPRISHVHYPAISEIVKATCKEFNLPYHDFPTMWGAVKSHFKVMKEFGQKDTTAEYLAKA
jgi:linoleoyl-CoA desaturase